MEIIKEFKNDLDMDCLTIKSSKFIFSSQEVKWFEPNTEIDCLKRNFDKYHEYDKKDESEI